MSVISSLIRYYDQLAYAEDPLLPPLGYSYQKIGFIIVLEKDGSLHAIEDIRQEVPVPGGLKLKCPEMVVPGLEKTGGSGMNPNLLWDQSGYLTGWKTDGKKDDPNPSRTLKTFEAFRDRHLSLERIINSPEFTVVCKWIEAWGPEKLTAAHKAAIGVDGGFGVFQIRAHQGYVHDVLEVKSYWENERLRQLNDSRATSQSLASGELIKPARLHQPKIKGVKGTQPAGAPIVSFNSPAYTHYGWDQGENASIGDSESFRYCTALTHLSNTLRQRIYIGETTLVYWTGQRSQAETMFGHLLSTPPEDANLRDKLHSALIDITQGRSPGQDFGSEQAPFYVLGLAGDAGRISVRYWLESNLGHLYKRLREHFMALATEREFDSQPEFPSIFQLLKETVRRGGKKDEPVRSGFPEELLRSILDGAPYPLSIYAAVLHRIKIECRVNYIKAAILKATLTRSSRISDSKTKITMSLDKDNNNIGYLMGRLFSLIERVQKKAIDANTVNRFFGSAASTPAQVFPRLIRGTMPHFAKLKLDPKNKGFALYHEKLMQEILDPVQSYPTRLDLADQGLFGIGYYHQRQSFFKKNGHNSNPEVDQQLEVENIGEEDNEQD